MKTLAGSLVLLSSFSLLAVGCGTDEPDDLTAADEALLTCNGVHGNLGLHRGHRHHRHHHGHGHGSTGTGGQPHITGMGGTTGAAGSSGGTMGTAGSSGGMGGAGGSGGSGGSGMMGGTGGSVPADPRCAPLDGMVSWWHADGDFDDAVGANDGTSGGAASFGPGIDHEAFLLNGGAGSYVLVPNAPDLNITGPITIDAWINQTALGGRIVDKATANEGYLMDVIAGRLRMLVAGEAALSEPLPAAMWVHVAGVFNGTGIGVYVNGALSSESVTHGSTIPTSNLPLHIGADANGGSQFPGMIDEPRIFNRALTADEITLLFWQGTNCQ